MPSSSLSSVRSKATSTPAKMAPHVLGGSKNLMSERFRREQAEQTLLKTKQNLKAVATELAPQVDELTKAVRMMQIEKHHQLNLDEASQEVLEGLQEQINEIRGRDVKFAVMLDDKLDALLEEMTESFRAEKYDLQVHVAHVQDSQDSLIAEVRLVQHEMTATKEFLSKQLQNMADAIDSTRKEMIRAKDQQLLVNQSIQARAAEMDEKLFTLDKELLKLKLAFPSSVSAQMPLQYGEGVQPSEVAFALTPKEFCRNGVGVTQKLHELSANLESMKAEIASYRSADRKQFDAITNRLRESNKSHQSLKSEMDARFDEIQNTCDSMLTKLPSELSRRFLKAQSQWEDELRSIRSRVDEFSRGVRPPTIPSGDVVELYDAKALQSMDAMIRLHVERLEELQGSITSLRTDFDVINQGQETTVEALRTAVRRLNTDVLGLYDWTKQNVAGIQEEVTFTTSVLQYFQQHAKILPKSA